MLALAHVLGGLTHRFFADFELQRLLQKLRLQPCPKRFRPSRGLHGRSGRGRNRMRDVHTHLGVSVRSRGICSAFRLESGKISNVNALQRIFEVKRDEVSRAKATTGLATLRADAESRRDVRGFQRALAQAAESLALIAEVKKASPSQGVIREDFDPAQIAEIYEENGAHALSVLTDVPHFQGSLENLRLAREASGLPCLRKDFVYDPYQVYEARAWGADAILLIVAALEDGQMADLHALATELGMDALVEVHDEREADRAMEMGAPLVGVNNRDLATFQTTLEISDRLLPRIAPHALAVSESALETSDDLERVRAHGARAVLIGTAFCKAPDIGAKVREVLGR